MSVFSREITKKEGSFCYPQAHTQFQELKPQLIISHDILFSSVIGGKRKRRKNRGGYIVLKGFRKNWHKKAFMALTDSNDALFIYLMQIGSFNNSNSLFKEEENA